MRDRKELFLASAITACLSGLVVAAHANNYPHSDPNNGAFSLDVVAYDPCPAGDFRSPNQRTIAVQAQFGHTDFVNGVTGTDGGEFAANLVSDNTIGLALGADLQATDRNACEQHGRDGAELILPGDLSGNFSVHVRLVGRPGPQIGVSTCGSEFKDEEIFEDNVIVCSMESVVELRSSGTETKPRFIDYTNKLLTVCLLKGTIYGECKMRAALFDRALEDYFWQWNTEGRRHAQLWFKPILPPM